jgi:CheY-like chemotaxis protein
MADNAIDRNNDTPVRTRDSQEFLLRERLEAPEQLAPFNEVSELRTGAEERLNESPETPGGPRRKGILIVDDEESVRAVLQVWLRHQDFAVWQVANGQEALELYLRHREAIDLILLDVRMPGLDGPETLMAFQQVNARICCCFMSGDLGSYTELDLRNAGAAAVIWKPFCLAEVGKLVRELADNAERRGFDT